MKLESILLGVLARQPSTGYDLKRYLDTVGRFLRSNTQMSQVYRSLAAMERNDWVRHTVEPRPGATDAKTYRITGDGMAVFLDWVAGPYQPPTRFQDPDLFVRLAFAGFLTRQQLLRLIDIELATRRDEIDRYRFRDRRAVTEAEVPFDAALAELVGEWSHRTGAAAMDAHVASLERLRTAVLDSPENADVPEYLARLDSAAR